MLMYSQGLTRAAGIQCAHSRRRPRSLWRLLHVLWCAVALVAMDSSNVGAQLQSTPPLHPYAISDNHLNDPTAATAITNPLHAPRSVRSETGAFHASNCGAAEVLYSGNTANRCTEHADSDLPRISTTSSNRQVGVVAPVVGYSTRLVVSLPKLLVMLAERRPAALLLSRMWQSLRTLCIGGTHFRGNNARYKTGPDAGKLDVTVLIVNPDTTEHDLTDLTVLSIVGSGLDLQLLRDVHQLDELLHHRFQRIQLQNFANMLPVAEGVDGISTEHFLAGIGPPPSFHRRDMETHFYAYVSAVHQAPYLNLYVLYAALLRDGGNLEFTSASRATLSSVLLKSVLDVENVGVRLVQQTDAANSVVDMRDASKLHRDISARLQQRGNVVHMLQWEELDEQHILQPDAAHAFYSIQMQLHLLHHSGFHITRVDIARRPAWGWTENHSVDDDAFTLEIDARKRTG